MSDIKKFFIVISCLLLGTALVVTALFLGGFLIFTLLSAAFIIVGCLLFAAILIVGFVWWKRFQLKRFKNAPLNLPENFTCTAHTGCCGTKPNSLDSINAAIECGADIIEFDLNFTSDGTPVLSHDSPSGGEVTLDEAFKKLSLYPLLKANVDVKNTSQLEKVKALADLHGVTGQIFYTGIFENDVPEVKIKTPDIPYYLNLKVEKNQSKAYLDSLVKKVKNCGAVGINFNKKNASKKLVNYFRKSGLLVSIWTADSSMDIHRLLSYAPDNITTKCPDRLYAIIKERMQ